MIINHKQFSGVECFKLKGSQDYLLLIPMENPKYWYHTLGAPVTCDALDPKDTRVHYCSGQSQPVWCEYGEQKGRPGSHWRAVSWAHIPNGWRAFFAGGLADWPEKAPLRAAMDATKTGGKR